MSTIRQLAASSTNLSELLPSLGMINELAEPIAIIQSLVDCSVFPCNYDDCGTVDLEASRKSDVSYIQ